MKNSMKAKFKGWKPAVAAKDAHKGCLCCPGPTDKLSLRTKLYMGFGGWMITRNGKHVDIGKQDGEYEDAPTLMKVENLARKEPDANWKAQLDTPLRGAIYQRHDKNTWVLIETNMGFA